ncbi:MAG: TetR/AcrR family transcriptional regulator [Rhizomicrobium sp.]
MDRTGQAASDMRAGVRSAASRTRRDQILKAGLTLFLKQGVGSTTVGAILDRCGASIGSFYHQFDGKADVAAALYLETLESYERAFLAELRKHDRARNGVEAAVRWHLTWTAKHPDHASYLIHCREPEVVNLSEARAQQINGIFYGEVSSWLRRHIDAGEIRKLPADVYFALWMGPANEFTKLWLLSGNRDLRKIERARGLLADAGWSALRAGA